MHNVQWHHWAQEYVSPALSVRLGRANQLEDCEARKKVGASADLRVKG